MQRYPGYPEINYDFTEEQIMLADLFRNNLYLTTKYLCGFNEENVTPGLTGLEYPMNSELHGTGASIVQWFLWDRMLFMWPRGYFTSSLLVIGFPVWLIINDPCVRMALGAYKEGIGTAISLKIQSIILSDRFKAIFPELTPGRKWTEAAFSINRAQEFTEETFEVICPGSSAESKHFDVMFTTDVINESNYRSMSELEKIISWANNLTNLSTSSQTKILHEGTAWHIKDLYSYIMKEHPEYVIYRLGAGGFGEPLTFEQKYPEKVLERKRKYDLTPKQYAANFDLTPIAEGESPLSGYQFLRYREIREKGKIVAYEIYDEDSGEIVDTWKEPILENGTLAVLDPATAKHGKDFNCTVVGKRDIRGRWLIRYGRAVKEMGQVEKLKELEKIDTYFTPFKIGIEIAALTEIDKELGDRRSRGDSRIDHKVVELSPHNIEKMKRMINALEIYLFRKEIAFHESIPTRYIDQIRLSGQVEFHDFADAVAHLPELAKKFHIEPQVEVSDSYMGDENVYPEAWGESEEEDIYDLTMGIYG